MSALDDLMSAIAVLDRPSALGALEQLGPGQIDGQVAIDRVSAMYRDLQVQAGKIVRLFGVKIPCEVQDRHNRAVAAYLTIAKSVFDQLAGKGAVVVQTLYNLDGQEVSKLTGPKLVSPMTFATSGCPGAAVVATADVVETTAPAFAGFGRGGLGQLGIWPLVARIVIALIAAGGAALVAREIVVNWPNEHEQVQKAQKVWMDNYFTCLDGRMKTGASAEAADAACRGVAGAAPEPRPATSPLATVGIIAIATVAGLVGGYLLFRALSPSERERRQRIAEAEEEAKRLQAEAKRIRRAARSGSTTRRSIAPVDDMEPAMAGTFGGTRVSRDGVSRDGVPARFRGCLCF